MRRINWQNATLMIAVIAVLQIITTFVSLQIAIFFMKSCHAYGTLSWECSGTVDPTYWQLGAVVIVPPLLAKILLVKLRISWKKIIVTHFFVLIALLVFTLYTDPANNCGCGGA